MLVRKNEPWYLAIGVGAVMLVAFLAAAPQLEVAGEEERKIGAATLRVVSATSTDAVLEPYIVPQVGLRITSGGIFDERTLYCEQWEVRRAVSGVSYPSVEMRCEGGLRMTMTEIDLTTPEGR